jgi:hypothetical protein
MAVVSLEHPGEMFHALVAQRHRRLFHRKPLRQQFIRPGHPLLHQPGPRRLSHPARKIPLQASDRHPARSGQPPQRPTGLPRQLPPIRNAIQATPHRDTRAWLGVQPPDGDRSRIWRCGSTLGWHIAVAPAGGPLALPGSNPRCCQLPTVTCRRETCFPSGTHSAGCPHDEPQRARLYGELCLRTSTRPPRAPPRAAAIYAPTVIRPAPHARYARRTPGGLQSPCPSTTFTAEHTHYRPPRPGFQDTRSLVILEHRTMTWNIRHRVKHLTVHSPYHSGPSFASLAAHALSRTHSSATRAFGRHDTVLARR